jgi:hypothetical protein
MKKNAFITFCSCWHQISDNMTYATAKYIFCNRIIYGHYEVARLNIENEVV